MGSSSDALRKPVPGRLFEVVKWVSWIELAVFAGLIFFWLVPGFESETFVFGLGHARFAEEIRVRWPSGSETRLENVPSGRYLLLIEGAPGGMD